jgi:Aerobic-type carbon monoxide dehydrogenase, small subunit CoxS/CutS homologs
MTLDFARRVEVTLRLNGRDLTTVVSPRTTLLDWLRDDIGLTGAKKGCNEGACGTCTVLVDGRRDERVPDPGRTVRGPVGHHRGGPGRRTGSCTRSSGPSPNTTRSSAATAPRVS